MKTINTLLILISLALFTSCGSDNDTKASENNSVTGINTLNTNQFNYQFCGTLVSGSFGGNVLFRNYNSPIRLFPENYSQEVQNQLSSATNGGRNACVYSRSQPVYDYGMLTFYVEAVQFF